MTSSESYPQGIGEAYNELVQYFEEKHAMGVLDKFPATWINVFHVYANVQISVFKSLVVPWLNQFTADRQITCSVVCEGVEGAAVCRDTDPLNDFTPETWVVIRVQIEPDAVEKGVVVYGR